MIIMNKTKPTFKRGDVVLVLFPNSDLTTAKTRPALIIQADDLNTGLSQVIIAMITSQLSRANHLSRVTILLNSLNGQNSGLLANSVVMTDNLATVKISAIYRVIGYLATEEIDQALKYTLSL